MLIMLEHVLYEKSSDTVKITIIANKSLILYCYFTKAKRNDYILPLFKVLFCKYAMNWSKEAFFNPMGLFSKT